MLTLIFTQVFFFLLFLPFTVTVILAVPFFLAFTTPFLVTVATFLLLVLKVTDFFAFAGFTVTLILAVLPLVREYVFLVTFFLPIFRVILFTFLALAASTGVLTQIEDAVSATARPSAKKRL